MWLIYAMHQSFASDSIWGDPAVIKDVILNEQSVSISMNLAMAIHHLWTFAILPELEYHGKRPMLLFYLWADALSINQRNNSEKNSQVKLMANIYWSAATVISWLGPGDEQIMHAFRTILETEKLMTYSLAGFLDWDWMRNYPQLWEEDQRGRSLPDFWQGIERLNHLPYWRHVWIIQE